MTLNRQRRYRWWMREQVATIACACRVGRISVREAALWLKREGVSLEVTHRVLLTPARGPVQ